MKNRAFTLIELLVVVLIIGILAVIALPQYQKAVEKSRAAEAFTNMATIKRAMDIYIMEKGWPSDYASLSNILEATGTELSGGEWQGIAEDNDVSYHTKNFSYKGSCRHSMCDIQIDRESEDGYYSLVKSLHSDRDSEGAYEAGWGPLECITQHTDFGRRICKSLPDCEYLDYEY